MITARTGIPHVAVLLLALSWIGTASAADVEIKKSVATAGSEPPRSFFVARRAPLNRQPVRLALGDVRMPACCMSLILGVGY
jgi:hypothetical protein